jgi:hypothetical protein
MDRNKMAPMASVFTQLKERRRSIIDPPGSSSDENNRLNDVDTTACDKEILLDFFENEVHEKRRLQRKAIKKEEARPALIRLWRPITRRFSIFGEDGGDVEIQSLSSSDRHRRAAIIVKQLQNDVVSAQNDVVVCTTSSNIVSSIKLTHPPSCSCWFS